MPDDLHAPDSASTRLGPNEVAVFADIVTEAEQAALIHWVDTAMEQGALIRNPRAQASFSTPYLGADARLTQMTRMDRTNAEMHPVWIPEGTNRVPPLPQEFWTIRYRVIARLGLADIPEDPYKGSFLNHILDGGDVHRHVDDRISLNGQEAMILRCNVLFRRPEQGGLPVIGGREIDVPERGMWGFYATEIDHSATSVNGAGGRSSLSFGFAVTPDLLTNRRFHVASSLSAAFADPSNGLTPTALVEQMSAADGFERISPDRIALLVSLLAMPGSFTLAGATTDGANPDTAWHIARQLQAVGLLESLSQRRTDGQVHII